MKQNILVPVIISGALCFIIGFVGWALLTMPTTAKKTPISNPLEFQVVTTKSYGGEMIGVQVKITNVSNRHINSCDVSCILQDAKGKDLGFERNYVIKSIDGGLAPGAFTYFEYVIDSRPELVKNVLFHIEKIDW
jgi:hypothetical protein